MRTKRGLAVVFALNACFAFAACEEDPEPTFVHEHSYATEWTKDADEHWHACTGEGCTEGSGKEAHDWNAGEITAEASASADGVKTYTCTVCLQTKTESVPYVVVSEVTEEEWFAALSFANVMNYQISSVSTKTTQTVEYDGVSVHSTAYMGDQIQIDGYLTKEGDKYYDVDMQTGDREECSKAEYDNARSVGMEITFLYDDFQYDEESETYKADEILLELGGMQMTYSNVEITFENKRIVKMTYSAYNPILGADEGEVTVSYGNVETIVLP